MGATSNHANENENHCKWRNETCAQCNGGDPFSTDCCCHAAIMLYYSSGNILCPKCLNEYIHLNKNKEFICENCGFNTNYEIILDFLIHSPQYD